MKKMHAEIVVTVDRGNFTESKHAVSALVMDAGGREKMSFGNCDQSIFPRSSIKPLQAIPIVTSGAYKRFSIGSEELAIACASHNGEVRHVELVAQWLQRLKLQISDLECGAHAPANTAASNELVGRQQNFSALHNNCSGKHTGMLAVALALETDTHNYTNYSHPVQALIRSTIENYCEFKITDQLSAIDGCSIPTYFLPMRSLATGLARFSSRNSDLNPYAEAATLIYSAMVTHPFLVAGTERYCTRMMGLLGGRAVVKTGAEGVMFVAIPELELGLVVKAHDGATRASEAACSWLLNELGLFSSNDWPQIEKTRIKNWNGLETGSISVKN